MQADIREELASQFSFEFRQQTSIFMLISKIVILISKNYLQVLTLNRLYRRQQEIKCITIANPLSALTNCLCNLGQTNDVTLNSTHRLVSYGFGRGHNYQFTSLQISPISDSPRYLWYFFICTLVFLIYLLQQSSAAPRYLYGFQQLEISVQAVGI